VYCFHCHFSFLPLFQQKWGHWSFSFDFPLCTVFIVTFRFIPCFDKTGAQWPQFVVLYR
jgi:hypothetical protein